MQPGKDDVIPLASQASIWFADQKVCICGNDSEFRHLGRRQRADIARVMIGKLHQRRANAAEVGSEEGSDVRTAVGRGDHDEAAKVPWKVLGQGQPADDTAHAVRDEMDAVVAPLLHLSQYSRQFLAVTLQG